MKKTRKGLSAHDEPADHGVYGPMAADEAHIADEMEHCKLPVVLDDRRDGIEGHCEAGLVNLALQKKGRREGESARREQTRWLGDCERTWRSVLKVGVQWKIREHESLCSLPVRWEADDGLHFGILMLEAWPPVHLTTLQGCCHFDTLHALVELAIVYEKVQPRAVEK